MTIFYLLAVPIPARAENDTNRFMRGFMNTTTGALEIPFQTVNSTLTKPFPFGVVDGVVRGTVYSMTKIFGGLFDMGAAAAPYAKYGLFFI
jgi:hypothetical protein